MPKNIHPLAVAAVVAASTFTLQDAVAMRQPGHVYEDHAGGHCVIRVHMPSGGMHATDYGAIGDTACHLVWRATHSYYSWMYNHAPY